MRTAATEGQFRAVDLPTSSALARARATLVAIEPASETERGLVDGMRQVLDMIEQGYRRVDEIEDGIEAFWRHFDWLVEHRLRIRGLRHLAEELEAAEAP